MTTTTVIIDGENLTLEDFTQVVLNKCPVKIYPAAIEKMKQSRQMVEQLVEKGVPFMASRLGLANLVIP